MNLEVDARKDCTFFFPQNTDERLIGYLSEKARQQGYAVNEWHTLTEPDEPIVPQLLGAIQDSARVVAVLHDEAGNFSHNVFFEAGYAKGYQQGLHPAPGPVLIMVARQDLVPQGPFYAGAYQIAKFQSEDRLAEDSEFDVCLTRFLEPNPPEQHESLAAKCEECLSTLPGESALEQRVTAILNSTTMLKTEGAVIRGLETMADTLVAAADVTRFAEKDSTVICGDEVRKRLTRDLGQLKANALKGKGVQAKKGAAFEVDMKRVRGFVEWTDYVARAAESVNTHPAFCMVTMLVATVLAVLAWSLVVFGVESLTGAQPLMDSAIWQGGRPTTGLVLSWLLTSTAFAIIRSTGRGLGWVAAVLALILWLVPQEFSLVRLVATLVGYVLILSRVPRPRSIFGSRQRRLLLAAPRALAATLAFGTLSLGLLWLDGVEWDLGRLRDASLSLEVLSRSVIRGCAVGFSFLFAETMLAVPLRLKRRPKGYRSLADV